MEYLSIPFGILHSVYVKTVEKSTFNFQFLLGFYQESSGQGKTGRSLSIPFGILHEFKGTLKEEGFRSFNSFWDSTYSDGIPEFLQIYVFQFLLGFYRKFISKLYLGRGIYVFLGLFLPVARVFFLR